jgi:hypothetical protein
MPGTPQLVKLKANLPVPSCGATPAPGNVSTSNNGAILYWPGAEPFEDALIPDGAPLGRLLLTLRPSTAIVRVYAVPGQDRQLLVKFRDGGYTFQVSVAVGGNGRTAGRVIASILPNPDDA